MIQHIYTPLADADYNYIYVGHTANPYNLEEKNPETYIGERKGNTLGHHGHETQPLEPLGTEKLLHTTYSLSLETPSHCQEEWMGWQMVMKEDG